MAGPRLRRTFFCAAVLLLVHGAGSRAGDNAEELRALIEQQGKQIQELQQQLNGLKGQTPTNEPGGASHLPASVPNANASGPIHEEAAPDGDTSASKLDDAAVKKIVGDYLKDNPG